MLTEIETKEKQEYLRINILEKGYNADEFMDYLKTLKGENSLEISNWSKEDLIKAVENFINKSQGINNKENINKKEDNYIINNNLIYNNENNTIKNENIINNNNNNNNNLSFNNDEYIKCKVSEKTEISTKNNLEITISDPQTVDGGLFSKSYTTYLVQTKPLNFSVRRRFSDFEWLRNILMRQYINCIIPPVYKKSFLMSSVTDNIIYKRIRVLKKFINEISIHPLLRSSQIFYDFLSINNEKEFNNKKNIYNKLSVPTKSEEIKTLSSIINIGINNEKDLFGDKIKIICENNEELMKKLSKEYKLLNTKIEELVSKMENIKSIWDELYKKSNKNLEGETISGIYDVMAKLMEDWAKMEKNTINFINIKLREYFRYIRNEYKCIREYYYIYENSKNQFIKSHVKLIDNKEKLFEGQNPEEWGIDKNDINSDYIHLLLSNKDLAMSKMLPEETKKDNENRKIYGIYLNSLIDEYENIKNINKKRHKENILNFIKEMIDNLTNYHVCLTGLIAFIDSMKEDTFIDDN